MGNVQQLVLKPLKWPPVVLTELASTLDVLLGKRESAWKATPAPLHTASLPPEILLDNRNVISKLPLENRDTKLINKQSS